MKDYKFVRKLFRTFFLIYFLSYNKLSYSQGGWNIKYIPIDSVTNKILGQEIRVDFTPLPVENSLRSISIRSLLSTDDTVSLIVNNKVVKFKENWKIYVDQGFLKEQSLESIGKVNGKRLIIKEIFLESISDSTIGIAAYLYIREFHSKGLQSASKVKINMDKKRIKGFLIAM